MDPAPTARRKILVDDQFIAHFSAESAPLSAQVFPMFPISETGRDDLDV